MSLNTVYLDARYRTSLEHVAHEAGWVSHDVDGDAITTRVLARYSRTSIQRTATMTYTALLQRESSATMAQWSAVLLVFSMVTKHNDGAYVPKQRVAL